MELTVEPHCEPAVSEANLEHLSLSDPLSSVEAPLDGIEHGMEAAVRNSGLELKLDLYVPIPPIIEPITPVEETVEHCVLPVATQEDDTQPEATKGETDANAEHFECENQPSVIESSSDTVTEAQCEQASNETASSDCKAAPCKPEEAVSSKETPQTRKASSGRKAYNTERKNIPPKKDKFNPLRIDMAKVIPLTSSQLSLQCMECHIIFSDSKSRDRHIKLSHPAEYQKNMMRDVVFTCYVCDQSFTCSTELMAHQRTHTDNGRFKCPFCSEAFYTSSELTSHKKKIHYSKHGYSCTECGKPFKTFTLLRYHQRVHTAEKPYVCPREACDKMFSTSKSLRNHLQKHQKEEGKGDQTNASTTIKKKKTKETSERKFPCPHCEAVFKASKARLLHIKNKHSQESQSSTVLVPQPKAPGPTLVHTANGQPPTLFVETVGPASHPMAANKLDAVQIKRLIEKLGNVQKVNQLVILPLQPHRFGLPHPQPLHVNFTQPTQFEQPNTDPSNADQINLSNLQPKEAAVLSQEEKSFYPENSEIQVTPVELTQTEAQMQMEEIHLELIPIQTEPSVLLDQTPLQVEASQNNSVLELPRTIEENITVTQANESLETNEEPPLIPQPEMQKSNHVEGVAALERNNDPPLILQPETSKSYHVKGIASLETNDEVSLFSQPETKTKPNQVEGIATFEINNEPPLISQSEIAKSHVEEDIVQDYKVTSEEIVSKTEMPCPTQDSTDISIGSHLEVIIKQGDINKLSKPQEVLQIQAQKEQVESEQQPCIEEPQPQPDSFNSVQNDKIVNQQSSVPTPNQTQVGLQNSTCVQKKLPTKKKRSKKQLGDERENKEPSKESDNTASSSKKVKTSSKVNPKKKENAKNKKLVVRFGPSEKKKSSKPKVIKTSKTKQNQNQQICDEGHVPALSENENKLDSNQKLQKDKKGKGAESPSGGTVKSVGQTNNATDSVLVAPEAAQKGKPQKRKLKNPNNLVKKAKSVPEAQQDKPAVHMPKKKKQAKISEDDGPKKPKVRKTQNDAFQKKTQKIPKHKAKQAKCSPDVPDQAHIEKQALLLLKGHKQPQLKVHKLDATELEKSPPSKNDNKVLQKNKNAKNKSLNVAHQKKKKSGGTKLLEHLGESLSLEMPLVENSPGSVPTKPKIVRKRKAPIKMDQEIALSPPYSQLTLGCQDCGKTFSEVSALQQHMASWHSAGKLVFSDEINVAKKRVIQTSPKEKRILSNVFEIQVATDWDIETEVGEIVGERLSFPALSPSPSLTLASNCADGKEQEGDKDAEGIALGFEEPAEKNSSEVCEISTKSSTLVLVKTIVPQEVTEDAVESVSAKEQSNEFNPITEISCDKVKDAAEEEIKEELPLGVNLIMVGDQNAEENHNTEVRNISGVSQEPENEVSNPCSQSQEPAKDAETVMNQNVLTEIKQEEEEVLVREADDNKRVIGGNSVKKGKKGVGKAWGKKSVGRRTSTENRSKKDMEENKEAEECQVLYHLCIVDSPEIKNKETDKNGVNSSETPQVSTSDEAPEEQVVFELDSVTTSVMDIVNSEEGSFETSQELVREGSSPGIILEKFFTARERNMETPNIQSPVRQANSKMDNSKVISAGTSSDVKMEERSSNLVQHNPTSSEGGLLRGVQMFLVKAEDHVSATEIFQTLQPAPPQRVACPDKAADKTAVPIQNYSKQCIFYPVKEEERELLVESPPAAQTSLGSREHTGPSSGLEECEEIRVDSVQMDMQQLYTNSEEGDVSEQQRTQGFLEFLSENTDAVDAGNIHSEPEAETIVMSCYHGIQSNGTVHHNGTERSDPCVRANVGASPVSHREPERQLWKPITYFNQYFSLDTWKEIAVCTSKASTLPDPVTEKEVAKYVGIHIAMGTLKFPSTKLYWEDYTRVPLISDAMSASRFCELACKLTLVGSAGSSTELSIDQHSEETNSEQPGQSNKVAHDCTNSKTDPLWKVMPLIRRVQDGCQALDRNGSYGVDQYPLPFQRHPTHSLLHTVVVSGGGLVLDFNLSIDDSNRENFVEKMVSKGKERNDGMVFLCKPELSTPSMLEHLLEAGVQSAGKVGGARGQIGDEFVSSDGKLKLFRCHHGFILSAVVKEKPRSTSLVSGFERAIKAANLNRDLRSLYRTPCTNSAISAWPQSVLWDLIDLVLVNAWIQYKQDHSDITDLLSLMAFRLEVAKALILSSGVDAQDLSPPCPPAPKIHSSDTNARPSQVLDNPLPDEHTRYDGFGHWPEQLAEGEEARRCRFGGCERTSRVRCLKCCVYLCISRNHNCFLKFHSQGSS